MSGNRLIIQSQLPPARRTCRTQATNTCAYNNYFISEDSEKAETFNQYFAKQMSISNNIADLPTLPPFSYITDERLGTIDVNEADVLRYLRQVNIHKSYGPD